MKPEQKNIVVIILWIAGAILTTSGWFMFGIRDAQAQEINKNAIKIERLENIVNDIPVIKNDISYIKEFIKELRGIK